VRRKRRRPGDDREDRKRNDAPEPIVIPHDPVNEAALLAAALASSEEQLDKLLLRARADHFQTRLFADAWQAIAEARRRKLSVDIAVVEKLAGEDAARALARVAEDGAPQNPAWHLENLLWDSARAGAARGPVPAFLEALRDPRAEPERVRALARSIVVAFDGYEERSHLLEPKQLVRDQMREVEERVAGRATFPFGLPGLDRYEDGRRRMLPGAKPGMVTTVTAVSGAGKSTLTAHLTLGLAGWEHRADGSGYDPPESPEGRRVIYGAWEPSGGMTLELLATISLGWSRTAMSDPQNVEGSPIRTPEGREVLRARMDEITDRVRFWANPFRKRRGEKPSNERNLDLVHGYLADSGCDVFVADLWKRCLRYTDPESEEEALVHQQAMIEELRMHAVLLQQQRLKDIEMRPDKRPTREGIKGSGAWIEISDNIVAPHRPALWKKLEDNKLEIFVLKQRWGIWPLGIEFDWDPDRGAVWGGRSIEYDRPGDGNDMDVSVAGSFLRQKGGKRKSGRGQL